MISAISPTRSIADEAEGESSRIPWVQLPELCKQAIRNYSDKVDLLYIEKETYFGRPVYEVKMDVDGVFTSIDLSADGRFLRVEEISPERSLPKPVLKAKSDAETDHKLGVRVKSVVTYTYLLEFEDERPPVHVDATGTVVTTILENH